MTNLERAEKLIKIFEGTKCDLTENPKLKEKKRPCYCDYGYHPEGH